MVLDAASLEAITQEIRTCFLYEDAPDHLAVLEQGIRQLRSTDAATNPQADYAALMRAAHSLKGGAGIAQFSNLSKLAHKLEDLLQALHQGSVKERASAYELLSISVELLSNLITEATSHQDVSFAIAAEGATLVPAIAALENFLLEQGSERAGAGTSWERRSGSRDELGAKEREQGRAGSRGEERISLSLPHHPITPSPPLPLSPSPPAPIRLNLRIPVSRLDRMNNTIGELFISHERLSLYQKQLHQVDVTFKKRVQQLKVIGERLEQAELLSEQMQTLYNQFAVPYSKLQNTLQDFHELIVQVQEARADVELISHEFSESLALVKQQLDSLRWDLTESRLVRFGLIARQFAAVQQTFSQRYNKSVELVIIGKETLIDQVILEQLKIPLTHLFRNAFAHGIETPEDRRESGKSPTAQIILSAAVLGNQLKIAVEDDGRGIDIQAVYQRAVSLGLCAPDADELTKEQILKFLFKPGFSTTSNVTALAGRGMGLDIVRVQVERLRGKVAVETKLGQGTKFTINIPLTLNILPLLLCRCQQQTLAIPSNKILEIIALSELEREGGVINWRERTLPLYPLMQLLPYARQTFPQFAQINQSLGIVLQVDREIIVVACDSLVEERELVLKPFDTTVQVPAYISGCTVLGTGEVVPVLSPDHFGELIAAKPRGVDASTPLAPNDSAATILIVDDAITVRQMLNRFLGDLGYKVVQCKNGKEAWEKLNQPGEHFDLVVSDIDMPYIDGLALLREIRSHHRWHSLAVVMLTARESEQYRLEAQNLGSQAYFTKPFNQSDLGAAIAALLS